MLTLPTDIGAHRGEIAMRQNRFNPSRSRPAAGSAVLVSLAAALLAACGGGGSSGSSGSAPPPSTTPPSSSAPPPSSPPPSSNGADLAGTWSVQASAKTSGSAVTSDGRGTVELSGTGSNLTGTAGFVATVASASSRETRGERGSVSGTVSSGSVRFTLGLPGPSGAVSCEFSGSFSGTSPSAMNGTITCGSGWSGTWQATKGVPAAASMTRIVAIDVGTMTVCASAADGQAYCWGENHVGQLATADALPGLTPHASAAGHAFRKISVSHGGGGHVCGITTSGQAYCWGNQEGGRLGDGISAPVWQYAPSPVPVSGSRTYVDIAVGGDHVCAIASGGAAYCWGHNERGQLGTGNNVSSAVPVAVAGGHSFKSISASVVATCAITDAGAAYCWGGWGDGMDMRLGTGSSSSNLPAAVKGGLTFSSISAGVFTTCGVVTDARGYCWGQDSVGELGMGSKGGMESEPALVTGGFTWKSISAGVMVTCGVTTAGRGYCWGGQAMGERGDGSFPAPDSASPVPVAGDLTFDSIDADWISCGVTTDGVAYCWGPGGHGGVGDGSMKNQGVPTRVAGQG